MLPSALGFATLVGNMIFVSLGFGFCIEVLCSVGVLGKTGGESSYLGCLWSVSIGIEMT